MFRLGETLSINMLDDPIDGFGCSYKLEALAIIPSLTGYCCSAVVGS